MNNESLKKSVFMGVRWGVRITPTILMLAHWVIVVVTHCNQLEPVYTDGNKACLFAMWFMTWVFPMIVLWFVGYLFDFGWLWKIPFVYALGVIMVRISHWTLVINNSTMLVDYALIGVVCIIYWSVLSVLGAKST